MSKEEIDKLKEKIILNSFYPIISNNSFQLFDKETAEKITLAGQKIIKRDD